MPPDTSPAPESPPRKAKLLDLGAGDPEAPANAIPNLIAHLVETETWRNAATVMTGLLLIVLGYWAYNGVRDSIAEARVTSLEALLGTVVTGLDVWVGEHRTEAVRLARDPEVVARATRLAAEARGQPPGAARCTTEAEDLGRILQSSLVTQGVVAFRIVDRTGLVLASKDPARCGQRLRSGAFRQRLDLAIDGAPQFVRPHPDPELSVKGVSEMRRPVAWLLAPIRQGNVPATMALAMGVETDRQLATIFSAARPGRTAEAYAFADDGLMLTESRFIDELVAAGMLADAAGVSSAFLIPVRDPGGHVTPESRPVLEPAARPLTRAAALAVAARADARNAAHGVIAGPYRELSRHRRDRRLALAAGVRHGRHRRDRHDRGVRRAALLLDQHRGDRHLHCAVAGRGTDVGDVARKAPEAIRPPAAARRVHARAPDQRGRDGDDLSRAARAAQAPDRDQDPEEARRDRRVPASVRARGAGREPALPPEHRAGLRLRPHARGAALLRDGISSTA